MTAAEAREYIRLLHLSYRHLPPIEYIPTRTGGTVLLWAATDTDVIRYALELIKTETETYQKHSHRIIKQ